VTLPSKSDFPAVYRSSGRGKSYFGVSAAEHAAAETLAESGNPKALSEMVSGSFPTPSTTVVPPRRVTLSAASTTDGLPMASNA